MANVLFNKGLLRNLPSDKTAGALYVTTDERAIYLDVDGNTRIRLGDFQEFASISELSKNTNPSTTALYYIADINCLAKWTGSQYIQINMDTGATEIEVVGEGNAVTAASYDPETRKITLTKGETYVTSVTAGDNSITVDGEDTDLTVAVAIDDTEGNALKLVSGKGLRVDIPDSDVYGLVKDENSGDFAAVYHLTKNGSNIGTAINIPKDMVVESGKVVTDPDDQPKGTYIELTLANANNDKLYINVGDLIEYVTSGSSDSDMVVIAIDDEHKVTATITDGSITLDKLTSDVQTKIEQAHTHTNADELAKINTGDVEKWNAAEQNAKDYADSLADNYDVAGAAEEALDDAKAYTDEKIQSATLTWGEF